MLPAFLSLSFDVLSVMSRLHNRWYPFKMQYYLVPPIVFSLRAQAFFTWGNYTTFHGMALPCHLEGSMITEVWTHLRMFLNSKVHIFHVFMLNLSFKLENMISELQRIQLGKNHKIGWHLSFILHIPFPILTQFKAWQSLCDC
jgi:hypothetical protein